MAAPTLDRGLLQDLRACLPDLRFAPTADPPVPIPELLDAYLHFYDLDLRRDHFHRLGRLVLPPWTLAVHYWLPGKSPEIPPQGAVVVVHGYFDHVGLYGHLVRHLLGRGYAVVAFDLPGHGLSSGERASIETFDHYVQAFADLLERLRGGFACPLSAVGQSTGGAILAKHLLARHRAGEAADLARVVLLAPLVAPAGWWYNRLLYLALRRFRRRLRRVPGAGSSDPAFRELLRRDPLQARALPMAWIGAMDRWIREVKQASPCPWPVRILQGTADATLAWRYNLRVLRKVFPAAQIQLLPGVRHHMVNERPALREQVFAALGL